MAHTAYSARERGATSDGGVERIALGRALLLDDGTYAEIAETFRALADATRTKIVYSLLQQELCTSELAAVGDVSESVVSQHLRVLRELRLIRSRREGKLVFHTLDDAHINILLSVALDHLRDAGRNGGSGDTLAFLASGDTRTQETAYGA